MKIHTKEKKKSLFDFFRFVFIAGFLLYIAGANMWEFARSNNELLFQGNALIFLVFSILYYAGLKKLEKL